MSSFKQLAASALLLVSLTASADFLRAEAGLGVFSAGTDGVVTQRDGSGDINLKDAGLGTESDLYVWAYVKQPVPLIPNVRLEYLNLTHSPDGDDKFDVSELDGILYYNLLDDTVFVTVDVGVDVKFVSSDSKGFDSTSTLALAYARARLEPTSSLGLETLLKVTGYGNNAGYDFRIKADYTLSFVPVVQPAVEIGYRMHMLEYMIGDYINKAEYSGVYGGLMVRF